MAKLRIGRATEDPNVIEWIDISDAVSVVEFEIDTSAIDELMDVGPTCPALCAVCEGVRCIGDDPHAECFGPFHVFPQHEHPTHLQR